MAEYTQNYMTDRDIMKLPFNKTRRGYHWTSYPWQALLPSIPTRGDVKYYNLQSTQGYAGTALSAAWAGGVATANLAVTSSALFKVNDKGVLCNDGSNSAQMVYVTAVPDATHVTVSSLDGATLISAKANGTRLTKAGQFETYEEYHRHVSRMPTREYNVFEKVMYRQIVPVNLWHSDLQDDSGVDYQILADAVSQWKQFATMVSIKGEMVDPTAIAGQEACMAGLDQILAGVGGSSYLTSLPLVVAADKENLRKAVMDIADNGGYPDAAVMGANVCLANSAFVRFWMGLDDDKDGISDKETDGPFMEFTIGAIKFRLCRDKAMTEIYGSTRPTAFFLTMRENGKSLINWAHVSDEKMNGKQIVIDQDSTVIRAVEVGEIATMDVKDQFKHMFFRSSTDLS